MASNDRAGIQVRQPRTSEERKKIAVRCSSALEIRMSLLLDGLDNEVGEAYSGFPDRLYVIDREGRVAYKGGRGPFGFDPREAEQALVVELLRHRAERL